jgi:hypothetical protein
MGDTDVTRDLQWHKGRHGWQVHDGYPRHQHSKNGALTIVSDDSRVHFQGGAEFTSPNAKAHARLAVVASNGHGQTHPPYENVEEDYGYHAHSLGGPVGCERCQLLRDNNGWLKLGETELHFDAPGRPRRDVLADRMQRAADEVAAIGLGHRISLSPAERLELDDAVRCLMRLAGRTRRGEVR